MQLKEENMKTTCKDGNSFCWFQHTFLTLDFYLQKVAYLLYFCTDIFLKVTINIFIYLLLYL